MSKCPNCGREIGNTAGPCVQCTILLKKESPKKVIGLSCPECNSTDLTSTDTVLILCNNCNRVF